METKMKTTKRSSRKARLWAIAFTVSAAILVSGCWIFGNAQIEVFFRPGGGASIVAVIHEKPTDQLELGNEVVFHDDEHAFLRFLRGQIVFGDDLKGRLALVGFELSDFSYFFDDDNAGDFGEAINNVKGTHRCLAMDRNPSTLGDRHNWTFREASDTHCHVGEPFPIVD